MAGLEGASYYVIEPYSTYYPACIIFFENPYSESIAVINES
jgi:hypothetical protein